MEGTLEKTESREWLTLENGGQKLFGFLHRPTAVDNPPVVILLHGFASSKHGSNRCYVKMAEAFAEQGIAAMRFDFRGSGDSEGTLKDVSFHDLISDAVMMAEHAAVIEGLDATRLGFFGASLGGAIAVQAASKQENTKALALWAPVASGELWFRDFLMQHPELAAHDPSKALNSYRGEELNPDFKAQFRELFAYKTLAALPHLPLLHMHGEGDETVTIAHQNAFKQGCKRENARFLTYADAQHSLGFSKMFPEVIGETLTFFKENL